MNGLRNLNELAADDAAVEAEIERTGGDALRLGLHAYAFHADGQLTSTDQETSLRALVRPPLPWRFLLPIALLSIGILYITWGV